MVLRCLLERHETLPNRVVPVYLVGAVTCFNLLGLFVNYEGVFLCKGEELERWVVPGVWCSACEY
ncbi:hypothetical protein CSUI_007774 [Cystoisospora suis]|uniref:Uncharacterized protein n=1 Tax=Cystoisospora suis TaxID=483139 RepID=A0A2C6KMP3_9APIC|nr:hypothetical protein CSUI_007774 [Cystoisospora suis]